jgi:hypothetical protein
MGRPPDPYNCHNAHGGIMVFQLQPCPSFSILDLPLQFNSIHNDRYLEMVVYVSHCQLVLVLDNRLVQPCKHIGLTKPWELTSACIAYRNKKVTSNTEKRLSWVIIFVHA